MSELFFFLISLEERILKMIVLFFSVNKKNVFLLAYWNEVILQTDCLDRKKRRRAVLRFLRVSEIK